MLKKTILLSSLIVLVGCSETRSYSRSILLSLGMTKDEVIAILGHPNEKEARGGAEKYIYSDVNVCFNKQGKLSSTDGVCSPYYWSK